MQTDDDLGRRVRAYALDLDDDTRDVSIDEIATRRSGGAHHRSRAVPVAVAAVTATALLVAAVAIARSRHQPPAPVVDAPVSLRVATDARAEVRDGRLSRSVLIDGGTLRLDPLAGVAAMPEARALALSARVPPAVSWVT